MGLAACSIAMHDHDGGYLVICCTAQPGIPYLRWQPAQAGALDRQADRSGLYLLAQMPTSILGIIWDAGTIL